MSKAPIYILEGTWWSHHEVPLVLPYFHALAISHRSIDLSHRTIRCLEDIEYYVSKISKNAGAFLYFACHGDHNCLVPADSRSKIPQDALLKALAKAQPGAVSFVHFGCCEMVDKKRRLSHEYILKACGAKWASGYTKAVDWLRSTVFDLALVSEIFVPHCKYDGKSFKLKNEAGNFVKLYEQAARELGFSALAQVSSGPMLIPKRLNQ